MFKKEKLKNLICETAAEFFERERIDEPLVTVTNCRVSPDGKNAVVLISVFPESKEEIALLSCQRKLSGLRNYLSKKMRSKNLPHLQIEIDRGEQSRQRIEELLNRPLSY